MTHDELKTLAESLSSRYRSASDYTAVCDGYLALSAKLETLRQWQVTVTASLGLLSCCPFEDVPKEVRLLRAKLEEAQAALALTQRTAFGSFAGGWTILVTGHEMNAIRAALDGPTELFTSSQKGSR